MDISINKLFIYDKVYQLLLKDGSCVCYKTDNGPMYKRPLKLHKGIDNTLKFRVFNPDHKPVNLNNYSVYARIINTETNQQILEKKLTRLTTTGVVSLFIDEVDLQNVVTGLYKLVIYTQIDNMINQHKASMPIFSDFDNNMDFTVEITNQFQREPYPSIEITPDLWTSNSNTPSQYGPLEVYYVSSAIPSSKLQNRQGSITSLSIETEEFYGHIEVYGTLTQEPSTELDRSWFKVELEPNKNRITFINYTGTEYFSFENNAMWYRVLYMPNYNEMSYGEVKKVIVRS